MFKPPFLEIAITDMCNASCCMCPPEVHSGSTIMKREMFERRITEAASVGIKKLVLTGGEPLLDVDIDSKIAFAKSNGFAYVHMFTNGQLLDRNKAISIINSGLDSLTVSIDTVISHEYSEIRAGLNFETVMENIRSFRKIRDELESIKPLFRVNRVNLLNNKKSVSEYIATMKKFADVVELMDAHNCGSEKNNEYINGNIYAQDIRHPCNLLFQKICINPNGSIQKCSIDNIMLYGDDVDIKSALHGKSAEIKQRILRGEYDIDGCRDCKHKQSWLIDWELI